MFYRDIVVQIDRPDAKGRYEAAASLAARSNGRLRGVYLKTSLINQYNSIDPIAWLPPDTLNQLIHEHNAAQDNAADASGAALLEIAKRVGVEAEWEVVSGDTPGRPGRDRALSPTSSSCRRRPRSRPTACTPRPWRSEWRAAARC